jgi:hypothetical protein
MKKQDISVTSLVDMFKQGELQLPEIQRQYVWKAPRVRDLLDSLYRQYPSGSILLWETDEPVPTQRPGIIQKTTPFEGRKLLLDGQQRLTSLAAVMNGEPVRVRGRKRPIDILFNLEHPEKLIEVVEMDSDESSLLDDTEDNSDEDDEEEEEVLSERLNQRTFIVSSKALAAKPNWVSVSEVFKSASDASLLKKAGVTSFEDSRFQKYTERLQRLRKIRDYMYVVHVLERSMSYEEVTEIFVRVNSLGAKLRSSDLALAQITSSWSDKPNLLFLLEEYQQECEKSWFTLDLGLLVRSMVVFATKQCRFRVVAGTPIDKIKQGWQEAKEGLRYAINFLHTNAKIEDESLLSSPFVMIPIAVYSRLKHNKLSREDVRYLHYWLLVANSRGRYSGSSETALNEDLAILFRGGEPKDLLTPMERQFGRFTIEPNDMIGRGAKSPLFPLAFLSLKAAGAQDWFTGLGLSLAHQGQLHFIQWHHIFPKSLLKKENYERPEINELANIAFISGQTNRRLSNKEPGVYFKDIAEKYGDEALRNQAIPEDPKLHKLTNFRDFLSERRQLLAERMNKHLENALKGKV